MTKAIIIETNGQYDEILAVQAAEPGTARDLTAEEHAIAEAILDAEDGYVVIIATADNEGQGRPVWYLTDDETPSLRDASGHICWPAGTTWPREAPTDPRDPTEMAIAWAAVDYPVRRDDPDDAADLAVSELQADPAGWCRFVPAHWQPVTWVKCYRTAYAAAWGR